MQGSAARATAVQQSPSGLSEVRSLRTAGQAPRRHLRHHWGRDVRPPTRGWHHLPKQPGKTHHAGNRNHPQGRPVSQEPGPEGQRLHQLREQDQVRPDRPTPPRARMGHCRPGPREDGVPMPKRLILQAEECVWGRLVDPCEAREQMSTYVR